MESDESEDEHSYLSMELTIPLDGHLCARRACPRCGLSFKQASAEADLSGILSAQVSRLRKGGQGAPVASGKRAWCPYCGHSDDAQSFLHDEQAQYLERLIFREVIEPMMAEVFRPFETLTSSKHMKVTVTHGPRSARPMLGPEETDMVRVRCLGCSELFKVMDDWRGALHCPDCGIELVGT